MKNVLSFIMIIFVALSVVSCDDSKYNMFNDNNKDYKVSEIEKIDTSLAVAVTEDRILVFQKKYVTSEIDSIKVSQIDHTLKYASFSISQFDLFMMGFTFACLIALILFVIFS
jgi:hypothetical protein